MNIKEIINKERWELLPHHLTRVKHHNAALDRIADAVLKRIAELDLRLGCCRDASAGKDLLIAKLEEHLPKVAKPTIICDGIWSFACGECQKPVNRDDAYCAKCGTKLDWT